MLRTSPDAPALGCSVCTKHHQRRLTLLFRLQLFSEKFCGPNKQSELRLHSTMLGDEGVGVSKAKLHSRVTLGVCLPALMSLTGCLEVTPQAAQETLSPIAAAYLKDPVKLCLASSDTFAQQTLDLYLDGVSDEDEDRLSEIKDIEARHLDRYTSVKSGPNAIARANAFVDLQMVRSQGRPIEIAKELEAKMPGLNRDSEKLAKAISSERRFYITICTISMAQSLPQVFAEPVNS